MPTATKKPLHVTTPEEAAKTARANHLRNQTRQRNAGGQGWIIRSPAYGTALAPSLAQNEVDRSLQIHRHIYNIRNADEPDDNGETGAKWDTYEGRTIIGVDGEWFTRNPIEAEYVKKYYVPMGYKLIDVAERYGQNIDDTMQLQIAKSIVDDGLVFDEDVEADEEHPDTPKILT